MLRRRRTGPGGQTSPRAVIYEGGTYEMCDRDERTSHQDPPGVIAPLVAKRDPGSISTHIQEAQEEEADDVEANDTPTPAEIRRDDLAPLPTPLGLDAAFVRTAPETIVLREQWSWAGDSFDVATLDGREVLTMRARFWSASLRKEFLAPNGDPLFTLRLRLTRFLRSYYLERPDGTTVLDMPQHWGWAHTRFSVQFRNAFTDAPATLHIEGSFAARTATVSWEGQPIARIRRQYAHWRTLTGRHTFLLEVAPGVDVALMVALVVGFDEGTRVWGPPGPYAGGGC